MMELGGSQVSFTTIVTVVVVQVLEEGDDHMLLNSIISSLLEELEPVI